ncbi:MAG: hypothetical protein ABL907_23900 [Hyphomicrobium sp.]
MSVRSAVGGILAGTLAGLGRLFWRSQPVASGAVAADHKAGNKAGQMASATQAVFTRPSLPARLSPAEQWDRLSGVLGKAVSSAGHARELQASAAQQIDLATYALYSLVDDLAAVMIEPLRRETAVVHHLEPQISRRPAAKALAA